MHLALLNCCISSVDLGLSSYGLTQVKVLTAVFYIFCPSLKCFFLALSSWGLLSSRPPTFRNGSLQRVPWLLSANPGDTRISPWRSERPAVRWRSRHRWVLQIPVQPEIPTWAICWRKIEVGCRWEGKEDTERQAAFVYSNVTRQKIWNRVNGGFAWWGVRKYGWKLSTLLHLCLSEEWKPPMMLHLHRAPLPQTPPALQQKQHDCLIHCVLFAVRVQKDKPKWMMSPTLMEQMF